MNFSNVTYTRMVTVTYYGISVPAESVTMTCHVSPTTHADPFGMRRGTGWYSETIVDQVSYAWWRRLIDTHERELLERRRQQNDLTRAKLMHFAYGEMLDLRDRRQRAERLPSVRESRPARCLPRIGGRRVRRRWRVTKVVRARRTRACGAVAANTKART